MSNFDFLAGIQPWSTLTPDILRDIAATFQTLHLDAGTDVYRLGERLNGLYIVRTGQIEVTDGDGTHLSTLGPRNTFGERGLMRDGRAATTARTTEPTDLLLLPAGRFVALVEGDAALRAFFSRARPVRAAPRSLVQTPAANLMTAAPATIPPETTVANAARIMRDRHISSLMIVDGGAVRGILTVRDVSGRVVAAGIDPSAPVSAVMTADPVSLPPDAIGSDVLHLMKERGVGHIPIVGADGLAGIVTQTDLVRYQSESSAEIIGDAARAPDVEALSAITARIPQLLCQLVGMGHRHDIVTRLITDVADAVTRRLLTLAEGALGPAPVPYLWLACGSQGRQEQTGISDQDNVLILSDAARPDDDAYFEAFARYVTTGLDACGYVFCPGEMMATNPLWRQPVRVWREYFRGWIDRPDPMAQMLASVMFDLRPIGGDRSLYAGLQAETLEAASQNSIFVAHMVSNSLKHTPPLGLWRSLATVRSGEHRARIDLKMNGVVPIVDLGRLYALRERLSAVNTRARLVEARATGILSESGGRDLLDAYNLIAQTRLDHQTGQIRKAEAPDNFMAPKSLSDFERGHLRDAFVVVRTMQSAARHRLGST